MNHYLTSQFILRLVYDDTVKMAIVKVPFTLITVVPFKLHGSTSDWNNVKTATTVPSAGLTIDRSMSAPLSRQIADRLREQILSGQFGPGYRLPSTRGLAKELSISRNTVLHAYDELIAEGYLEGKVGAGTTVARVLPETLLGPRSLNSRPTKSNGLAGNSPRLSSRGILLADASPLPGQAVPLQDWLKPFQSGVPAIDAFPHHLWARLVARRARRMYPDLMPYQDPAGYEPLRQSIAAYLGAARGVRCTADQIVIVSGSQGGLDLALRVLLDPGDSAWIEDPGYAGARSALIAAGAKSIPVPVDSDGLDLDVAIKRCPTARLAYVTPSHQFPLGGTMSLTRRLSLLDWATRTGAWIIEDDYDGEFRYRGRPLPALQGLRPDAPVVYLGTFSKVMFPALRLGYLVVPRDLTETFVKARRAIDAHPPALEQAVLADFIAEGHFGRHIRRMRALYAGRAQALTRAASANLKRLLEISSPAAGLGVVGWLPPGIDDRIATQQAAAFDVIVSPVSASSIEPLKRGGLVLGFAPVDEAIITAATQRLAEALKSLL